MGLFHIIGMEEHSKNEFIHFENQRGKIIAARI
jgi:hypothetical protein